MHFKVAMLPRGPGTLRPPLGIFHWILALSSRCSYTVARCALQLPPSPGNIEASIPVLFSLRGK